MIRHATRPVPGCHRPLAVLLLAAAIALSSAPARGQGADSLGGRELVPAEYEPLQADFSPDGRTVYFIRMKPEPSQIWSVPFAGDAAPQQLTRRSESFNDLDVAPDGKSIAVQYRTGDYDTAPRVGILDLAGASLRALATAPDAADRWPVWHPSGTLVLFVRGKHVDSSAPARAEADSFELVFCTQDGTVLHRAPVAGLGGPVAWSADGAGVYLCRRGDSGAGELVRIAVTIAGRGDPPKRDRGREERPAEAIRLAQPEVLLRPEGSLLRESCSDPRPAPDGRTVAITWSSERDFAFETRIFDLERRRVRNWLVDARLQATTGPWSPDGRWALVPWFRAEDEAYGIRIVPAPGGSPSVPERPGPVASGTALAAVPPDTLLWLRWLDIPADPYFDASHHQIYRLEAFQPGGKLRGVVEEDLLEFRLTGEDRFLALCDAGWSEPGKARLRRRLRDLRTGVEREWNRVDVRSLDDPDAVWEARKRLVGAPELSPGGTHVAAVALDPGDRAIVGIRGMADDAWFVKHVVPRDTRRVRDLRWSPGGERLAVDLVRKDGAAIWILSRDPSVAATMFDACREPVWDPDGKRLYAFRREDREAGDELVTIAVPGGETEQILAPEGEHGHGLQWHLRGRSLLFGTQAPEAFRKDSVLVAVDLRERRRRVVHTPGGMLLGFAKHPTRPWLAVLRCDFDVAELLNTKDLGRKRGRVVVYDLDDGTEQTVAADLPVGAHLSRIVRGAIQAGVDDVELPRSVAWVAGE